MAKIRKGDLVEVISGSDRGTQGEVIRVLRDRDRVVVQGVNYVTKHKRAVQNQQGGREGGIETVEAPIHVSNVALVDPKTKQPARVGVKLEQVEKDGFVRTVRTRYFKPSRRAEGVPAVEAEDAKGEDAKTDATNEAPATDATTAETSKPKQAKASAKKAPAKKAPAAAEQADVEAPAETEPAETEPAETAPADAEPAEAPKKPRKRAAATKKDDE